VEERVVVEREKKIVTIDATVADLRTTVARARDDVVIAEGEHSFDSDYQNM
jgi:hypothetical protein